MRPRQPKRFGPVRHPGTILIEDFLLPCEITQNALARAMAVPARRINEIVLGKRGISAETAILLSNVLGLDVGYWLGLQNDWDVEQARARLARRPAPEHWKDGRPLCAGAHRMGEVTRLDGMVFVVKNPGVPPHVVPRLPIFVAWPDLQLDPWAEKDR